VWAGAEVGGQAGQGDVGAGPVLGPVPVEQPVITAASFVERSGSAQHHVCNASVRLSRHSCSAAVASVSTTVISPPPTWIVV
jgi:hypothetical protein